MRIKPSILIAMIAGLVAVIAGQWVYFKGKFEAALPQLEARAGAAGLSISYDSRSIHGFPFRLEARYQNIRITKAAPQLSFALKAKQAVLIRQLLKNDLSLLYFEAPEFAAAAEGPLPGGQTGEHILAWSAPAMQTSLRSIGSHLARLSAVIDLPEGTTTLANTDGFAATQLQFHMNWPPAQRAAPETDIEPRLILNMQAAGLALNDVDTGPLPQTLDKIQIGGTLHLGPYYDLDPAGLRQWQADGGYFALSQLDMQWGDVTLGNTTGRIALDDAMRLKAQAEISVTGLPALTYAADKTGVFGLQEDMALMTLRLLRAGASGETAVPLNFDIDKGVLRLGPAPLVLLGAVVQQQVSER